VACLGNWALDVYSRGGPLRADEVSADCVQARARLIEDCQERSTLAGHPSRGTNELTLQLANSVRIGDRNAHIRNPSTAARVMGHLHPPRVTTPTGPAVRCCR